MKTYYIEYTNQEVDLEDCPFCGSDPIVKRLSLDSWFIRCSNKMCMAEQAVYRSLSEAAIHWNHRV